MEVSLPIRNTTGNSRKVFRMLRNENNFQSHLFHIITMSFMPLVALIAQLLVA